ncbi:hypothetical protein G7Z17_g4501 [Cylindrodendrum hubeiense]|uniref:Xaa-Pro dipeptidyl-peptidase C-terminal domain-containing protein n=1 Tax=Cylindrodendrum hubeiense TaxID=595255 RepID=A0A9P5HAL6_9HYPO|nr:hypothetical protein G7Z17_g4501 [Cylindrodendrum hubeiense]
MSLQINGVNVAIGPVLAPEDKAAGAYDPLNPSTKVITKGHRRTEKSRPFDSDVTFEKDVPLPMRDGVKIYCDIFRPVTDGKTPAIIIWSPYGKTGNGPHGLDMIPGRFGVPNDQVSGYEKFEGLDPAVWPARGYAIVNVDLRGSWDSEGIVPWLGEQDGKDGYDAIEYIAKLDWCSGKVATAGNSWLAMSQWHIAAQQPPHLAAIAPWEGAADFYRDTLCRGGIEYPYDTMWKLLENLMIGRTGAESVITMLKKYPLYNEYWEDKRVKLEKIKAPAYILASYSSSLHTTGSIRAYNELGSRDKWLRIHARQEWSDLYSPESVEDLSKFFDYYLKGINNDWTKTVPVRASILGFNKASSDEFGSITQVLYYQRNEKLSESPITENGSESYNAEFVPKQPEGDEEEIIFRYKFLKPTWLHGYSHLVLHVANDSHDDIDVFVQIKKLDSSGKQLVNMNVPLDKLIPPANDVSEVHNSCFLKYTGPTGSLRASHAISKVTPKPGNLTGDWPEYTHETRKPIPAGTITRLEIPIWPTAINFDAGESLAVKVSGHYMSYMEFDVLYGTSHKNKGRHTVHFGGKYDSHLVVPLMDPVSQ